ncbi:putative [ribosomal protein S5]-alanine N-acetyltransferase [Sesamum alatum]|uniref:[ribosomal protein S5]-alanine N-acetyltransferase n=1 Tax=Sesamum alatum TaxID=300844 RepID=A0AAE2CKM5_9LAMI|nr:putative [ribosomal protein S5]-alanine N-acetyltransferase [Sesamum alatum]
MDENSAKSEGEEKVQESSNITLRPIALSDVDDLMVWATDDRVTKFCLWETYTSKEQAVEYIKNQAIPHPWLRAVCIRNHAIGSITVTPCSGYGSCRAELGYVLAHKHWGKGIATRAVKMVVSMIFKEWPHLKRLQAVVHVENKGSQRVLEKAGFQREGVLRSYELLKGKAVDMVMFSILGNNSSVG